MKLLNILIASLAILLFSAFNLQAQIITTIAGDGYKDGNGFGRYSGDGGAATSASLYLPVAVAVDAVGNIYIADYNNNRIRKVNTSGVISTVAGNGSNIYSGDGGAATSASLNYPLGVAIDAVGNIYIADYGNNRIRKVNTSGVISTVAGSGNPFYDGDGGAAIKAGLMPYGVAVDSTGNIYIADAFFNSRIRKVDTSGVISTIAGNGTNGFSGDGGQANSASLNYPSGVAVDPLGNIYIADVDNFRIRKVDTNGVISTVAGNGIGGYSGDGGLATNASISPVGIAVDAMGNIFITEFGNNVIRKVNTLGVISTVAGKNGSGSFSGDGGQATNAGISPCSVAVDAVGNIFIADRDNHRIRKVSSGTVPITLASFAAITNNKTIQTNWHTSTELNTSHFIIQHSTNGSSFTDIGTVKAIGSGANGYSFTDNNPTNGINYYRLKSIDKDGASTYSKVVSVQLTIDNYQLSITPNPVKDIVTVKGSHIATIQVIDNLGKVTKIISLKDATNPTLSVSGLQAGTYHLRVQTTDGKVSSANFVKE